MNRLFFVLISVVGLAFYSSCDGGSGGAIYDQPPSGGFTVHTVYTCGLNLTGVCESYSTLVAGEKKSEISGKTPNGTVSSFNWVATAACINPNSPPCLNTAIVFIAGAIWPANWTFTWGSAGCYNKSFDLAVISSLVNLSCDVSILHGAAIDPTVFDVNDPPLTATITGEGIDPTYGMPLVQYYDSNGTLQAQAYATSVSSDGTSMVGPVPDFSSAPLGDYAGVMLNADANSNYYVIGTVAVSVIDSSSPPPNPCTCTNNVCMNCD